MVTQKDNEYIGNGQSWDLDRLYDGVHVLPPYQKATGSDWFKGTVNAIYQHISFIDRYDPENVTVTAGKELKGTDTYPVYIVKHGTV